jgi:dTMP kinase
MSSSKRGAFIVIEGLDRSGKSTQASLLHNRLHWQDLQDAGTTTPKVVLLKFPGTFTIQFATRTEYKCILRPHDSHREDD